MSEAIFALEEQRRCCGETRNRSQNSNTHQEYRCLPSDLLCFSVAPREHWHRLDGVSEIVVQFNTAALLENQMNQMTQARDWNVKLLTRVQGSCTVSESHVGSERTLRQTVCILHMDKAAPRQRPIPTLNRKVGQVLISVYMCLGH